MAQYRPAEELAWLRQYLSRLESKELTLSRGGVDFTQEEISVLNREVAHLERILARQQKYKGLALT
jgi:hypothetical protein